MTCCEIYLLLGNASKLNKSYMKMFPRVSSTTSSSSFSKKVCEIRSYSPRSRSDRARKAESFSKSARFSDFLERSPPWRLHHMLGKWYHRRELDFLSPSKLNFSTFSYQTFEKIDKNREIKPHQPSKSGARERIDLFTPATRMKRVASHDAL